MISRCYSDTNVIIILPQLLVEHPHHLRCNIILPCSKIFKFHFENIYKSLNNSFNSYSHSHFCEKVGDSVVFLLLELKREEFSNLSLRGFEVIPEYIPFSSH
jgi:hypothetical protein